MDSQTERKPKFKRTVLRELNWAEAIGKEVQLFKNKENERFTIRNRSRKVLGHVTDAVLMNVTFQTDIRLKYLSIATNRKEPHFWALGKLVAVAIELDETLLLPLSYNHKTDDCAYIEIGDNRIPLSNDKPLPLVVARESQIYAVLSLEGVDHALS